MTRRSIAQQALPFAGVLAGFRNKIINGDFDVWQRATSQVAGNYGSADRWAVSLGVDTISNSRQTHTVGQTSVPGNPKYFYRSVVTSTANAAAIATLQQPIEGVSTLSGKTATITFWAKADASKPIALELVQNFGTGGSPSSAVLSYVGQAALTTAWQKFSFTYAVPSISGKTLGSNGDDALSIIFWFDAGSNYNARTGTLGQRSGTYDISHISIVEGDATQEADPFSPRHIGQELALCQRYYQKSYPLDIAPGSNVHPSNGNIVAGTNGTPLLGKQAAASNRTSTSERFIVPLRGIPTVSYWDLQGNASRLSLADINSGVTAHNDDSDVYRTFSASPVGMAGQAGPTGSYYWAVMWTASAEI